MIYPYKYSKYNLEILKFITSGVIFFSHRTTIIYHSPFVYILNALATILSRFATLVSLYPLKKVSSIIVRYVRAFPPI